METKANYVIVGIFTLAAIVAAFAFVYWTAAIGDRGETATLRVRIPGSASGLGRGSAVLFNGVKVGDVTRVFIDVQNPSAAIADTTIDRLTPITTSTQADIGLAGLTGQANIELSGGNLQEPNILDEAEAQNRIAEITADPSAVTNLLQTAQNIFERADTVITNLEGFVSNTRDPLEQTARNAQTFSEALAQNAQGIDSFLESVSQLSDTVTEVSGRLDGTLASAQGLLDAVDRDKVRSFVDNAESISADLRATAERIDAISARIDGVVGSADGVVQSLSGTAASIGDVARRSQSAVARVDEILGAVSPDAVRSTLSNIEATSRSANAAAANIQGLSHRAGPIMDDVARLTGTFTSRNAQIEKFIADAGNLAERLASASTNLGGVVDRANAILGGVDTESVRTSIANIEQLTGTANRAAVTIGDASQTIANVANDVSRVTSSVSGRTDQINQFVADASQLAGRLNAASVRVDGILGRVDTLLGSDQANGLATEATATLRSFRQVAETLNGRIGPLADSFQRLSAQGLSSVQGLVQDGQRAVNRIESAVDDIQRNPQRILTGGEGEVRRYDGRARR